MAHVFGNLTNSAIRPIVVAAIGSPDDAIISAQRLTWTGAAKKMTEKPREADDNKGRHGHVLLFGGAHGKGGRAVDGLTRSPAFRRRPGHGRHR